MGIWGGIVNGSVWETGRPWPLPLLFSFLDVRWQFGLPHDPDRCATVCHMIQTDVLLSWSFVTCRQHDKLCDISCL